MEEDEDGEWVRYSDYAALVAAAMQEAERQIKFWQDDSAKAWDTCEARRLEAEQLREALQRAEYKLSAYVGVCSGDKELNGTVLPMVRAALAAAPARREIDADLSQV